MSGGTRLARYGASISSTQPTRLLCGEDSATTTAIPVNRPARAFNALVSQTPTSLAHAAIDIRAWATIPTDQTDQPLGPRRRIFFRSSTGRKRLLYQPCKSIQHQALSRVHQVDSFQRQLLESSLSGPTLKILALCRCPTRLCPARAEPLFATGPVGCGFISSRTLWPWSYLGRWERWLLCTPDIILVGVHWLSKTRIYCSSVV